MKLKRNIALVIGNSHYDEDYYKDLANPLNEADAIACVFSNLNMNILNRPKLAKFNLKEVPKMFLGTLFA